MSRHFYSETEIEWLRNNVKGISLKELTDRFNSIFNLDVSQEAISRQKVTHGLKSEINNGYFKKRNIPTHTRPIGSERINKDGFIEVKIAQPKEWRLKHHIIYEQYYGTKISRGDKLIFLDGNRSNFDIDNLFLLSNSEQVAMVKNKLFSNNPDITKVGISIAKVKCKLKDLKTVK